MRRVVLVVFGVAAVLGMGGRGYAQTMGAGTREGLAATHAVGTGVAVGEADAQGGRDAPPRSLEAIVRELGDNAFAVRQSAQTALDSIPASRREELGKWLKAATDPEVRAGLQGRIDTIDDVLALQRPNISLEFSEARLADVAEALTKALGVKIGRDYASDDFWTFSLSAKDISFWEVERLLSERRPVYIACQYSDNLRLANDDREWVSVDIHEGVKCLISPIRKAAQNQGAPVKYECTIGVRADPRIRILESQAPRFRPARDDQGNAWAFTSQFTEPRRIGFSPQYLASVVHSLVVDAPKTAGKMIGSLRGDVTMIVQVEEERAVIDEPAKHAGEAFAVGNVKVTLDKFQLKDAPAGVGKMFYFGLSFASNPANPQEVLEDPLCDCEFVGADNHVIFRHTYFEKVHSTGDASVGPVVDTKIVEPVRVVITAPSKVRRITVPFEFKDIPINPSWRPRYYGLTL